MEDATRGTRPQTAIDSPPLRRRTPASSQPQTAQTVSSAVTALRSRDSGSFDFDNPLVQTEGEKLYGHLVNYGSRKLAAARAPKRCWDLPASAQTCFSIKWVAILAVLGAIMAGTGIFYRIGGGEGSLLSAREWHFSDLFGQNIASWMVFLLTWALVLPGATLNAGLNSLGTLLLMMAAFSFFKGFTRYADPDEQALVVDKTVPLYRRAAKTSWIGTKITAYSTIAAFAPAVLAYISGKAGELSTFAIFMTGIPPLYISVANLYANIPPKYWDVLWEQLEAHQNIWMNARVRGELGTQDQIDQLLQFEHRNFFSNLFRMTSDPAEKEEIRLLLQRGISDRRATMMAIASTVGVVGAAGYMWVTKDLANYFMNPYAQFFTAAGLLYFAAVPYGRLSKNSMSASVKQIGSGQSTLADTVPPFRKDPGLNWGQNLLNGLFYYFSTGLKWITPAAIMTWGTNFVVDNEMIYDLACAVQKNSSYVADVLTNATNGTNPLAPLNCFYENITSVNTANLATKVAANTFGIVFGFPSSIATNGWFWFVMAMSLKLFFTINFSGDPETRKNIAVHEAYEEFRATMRAMPKRHIDLIVQYLSGTDKEIALAVWENRLGPDDKRELVENTFIRDVSELSEHPHVVVGFEQDPPPPPPRERSKCCSCWGNSSNLYKRVREEKPLQGQVIELGETQPLNVQQTGFGKKAGVVTL